MVWSKPEYTFITDASYCFRVILTVTGLTGKWSPHRLRARLLHAQAPGMNLWGEELPRPGSVLRIKEQDFFLE